MVRRVRSSASCLSSQQITQVRVWSIYKMGQHFVSILYIYYIYKHIKKTTPMGPLYIILNLKAVKLRFTGILRVFDMELLII